MIAIQLQEKLCNELFQYASCKGIARKLGYDFSLIGGSFAGHRLLNLKCSFGDIGKFNQQHFYHQPDNKVCPEAFLIPDNTILLGYFQSDFYFEHISDEIKQDFKLEQTQKAKEILEQYPVDKYCYMHIRGQDYTTHARLWLLPKEYWLKSMENMRKINPDLQFLVFTDDVNYATELFKEENITCMRNNELTDMYCLSHAKYLIMANSSFSWWSMYLNDDAEFIIGPNNWVNRSKVEERWKDFEFVPEGINYKKVNLWL